MPRPLTNGCLKRSFQVAAVIFTIGEVSSVSRSLSNVAHALKWTRGRIAPATLLLVLLAACEDSPTAPDIIRMAANGSLWAAVAVPAGTPEAATWLPFLSPSSDSASDRAAVSELLRSARAHRNSGEIAAALEAAAEASRRAAAAVAVSPPPPVLIGALGALDRWADRTAREFGESGLPWGPHAVEDVRARAAAARTALARGDTFAAVVSLDEGAAVLRMHAPEAVAVRVLDEADQLLADAELPPTTRRRAARLLHNARAGLAAGDGGKALHRALYVLQLAAGARPHQADARDGGGRP